MLRFIFILLFVVNKVQAARLVNLDNRADYKDLIHFGEHVGDRSIVILDELTHGEEDVFQLKSRLVKYLHQHKGFDAIVFESGMFDMATIWLNKNASVSEQASGNLFYMYANSPAVQSLLDYIDDQKNKARPLILAGFDGRLSGVSSKALLIPELEAHLLTHLPDVITAVNWKSFKSLLQQTVERKLPTSDNVDTKLFNQQARSLIKHLKIHSKQSIRTGYSSSEYYAQLIDGIVMLANVHWKTRRFDEHDLVMASNLNWLLKSELKNKKVIVWGHFIHVNKYGFYVAGSDNTTSILSKRYPNDIYVAHFSSAKGQYRDYISGKAIEIKSTGLQNVESKSLLGMEIISDEPYALFLDAGAIEKSINSINKNAVFRGIDYTSPIPAHLWSLYWDGMFILSSNKPSL